MNDGEDKKREVRLAYFQLCNEELRFFKLQQWRVAYYCLLLLAAILFLQDYIHDYLLIIFIGLIFIIGSFLLLEIQWSLYKHRKIIDELENKEFINEIKECMEVTKGVFARFMKIVSRWLYIGVFIFILLIACLTVLYAVITWTP